MIINKDKIKVGGYKFVDYFKVFDGLCRKGELIICIDYVTGEFIPCVLKEISGSRVTPVRLARRYFNTKKVCQKSLKVVE